MKIDLTESEVRLGVEIGVQRQMQNERKGAQHRYDVPADGDSWDMNIMGALGEMAVAKAFGLFWSGALGNYRADDVGEIQVRHTKRDNGCLILHDRDKDDRAFILNHRPLSGIPPSWLDHRVTHALIAPEQLRLPSCAAAFFVPQDQLHQVETLKNLVRM